MYQMRSVLGVASLRLDLVHRSAAAACPRGPSCRSPGRTGPLPARAGPSGAIRLNVRPIAMTSPTDFIWVVSTGSASGNFSNAQRGILVTT